MMRDNYAWMDHLPDDGDQAFGQERIDLQKAEQTLKPDIPDQVILRLYGFLLNREQDPLWHPLLHLCSGLLHLRMYGPRWCPKEYEVDFEPKDCELAEQALRSDALPNSNLLGLYFTAEDHAGVAPGVRAAPHYAWKWKPIFELATDKVLSRMATMRGIATRTMPWVSGIFQPENLRINER